MPTCELCTSTCRAAGSVVALAGEHPGDAAVAERRYPTNRAADDRMDRELVAQRAAQRDDAADQVRAAHGERPREYPAAALADDRDALAGGSDARLELVREARDRLVGAVAVRAQPARPRSIAAALQPVRHERQRAIAREEARHEQHRAAAAVGDARASPHRIRQQRRQFEARAGLAPDRRRGSAHRAGAAERTGSPFDVAVRGAQRRNSCNATVRL